MTITTARFSCSSSPAERLSARAFQPPSHHAPAAPPTQTRSSHNPTREPKWGRRAADRPLGIASLRQQPGNPAVRQRGKALGASGRRTGRGDGSSGHRTKAKIISGILRSTGSTKSCSYSYVQRTISRKVNPDEFRRSGSAPALIKNSIVAGLVLPGFRFRSSSETDTPSPPQ